MDVMIGKKEVLIGPSKKNLETEDEKEKVTAKRRTASITAMDRVLQIRVTSLLSHRILVVLSQCPPLLDLGDDPGLQ